jgi:hypothetical protein
MNLQTDMAKLVSSILDMLDRLTTIVYAERRDLPTEKLGEAHNALRDACTRLIAMHDNSVIVLEDILKYYNGRNTLVSAYKHITNRPRQ